MGCFRLVQIVRRTPWLMEALRAARDVDPPDWLLAAGAVTTAVWDHLHGFSSPSELADVDVGFFDADDLTPARDLAVQRALRARLGSVPWEAKNQAGVHLWYERRFGYAVEPCRRRPTRSRHSRRPRCAWGCA